MDSSKSPSSSMRLLRLQDEAEPPPPRAKNSLLLKLTAMAEALELVAAEAQTSETTALSRPSSPHVHRPRLTLVR